jgi:hypothetical protein
MELTIIEDMNPGANDDGRPKDFRGLIAVDDALDVHVIATTNDCELVDLFINGRGPIDNGIEYRKEDDLNVGLYHVQFLPWSHKDEYNGDYDGGVDIKVLGKCSDVPAEFLCGNEPEPSGCVDEGCPHFGQDVVCMPKEGGCTCVYNKKGESNE